MIERDERPLSEMRFAQDKDAPDTEEEARNVFGLIGVKVAQDIIDLGCTGLVGRTTLADAQRLRQSMSGSICGLPCYVPNHLFCLVHNTVGGLQTSGNKDGPQQNPHPEGLALCSRPLTPEEGGKLQGVQAFAQEEAVKEAAAHFGAEVNGDDAPISHGDSDFEDLPSCPVSLPPFVCREHNEFNPGCRYCLAQSIAEGDYSPQMIIRVQEGDDPCGLSVDSGKTLTDVLASPTATQVQLFILAGRWARKLVKE
jgi:hypothetical protein